MPDAIWIVVDSKIVYANPAAGTLFGANDASELVGLDNLIFIHPDDGNAILERRQVLNQGGRTEDSIFRRVRLDGSTFETDPLDS